MGKTTISIKQDVNLQEKPTLPTKRIPKPNRRYNDCQVLLEKTVQPDKKPAAAPSSKKKRCHIPASTKNKRVRTLGSKKKDVDSRPIKNTATEPDPQIKTKKNKIKSRKVKQNYGSRYHLDCTEMDETFIISNLLDFLMLNLVVQGKEITVKVKELKILIKCKTFLAKSLVRVFVKKYLKSENLIQKVKVASSSKRDYKLIKV